VPTTDTTDPPLVARPTFAIDGTEQAMLAQELISMLVVETTAGLYRAEIVFGNWGGTNAQIDFLFFDRKTLEFGKTLKITIGRETLFAGRISGLEGRFPEGGSPQLAVLAEDRLFDLRVTRRTRSFSDTSDADLCRTIAQDHGLTPDIQLDGPQHTLLAQVNQSDLAFLRERTRMLDAELWISDRTLFVRQHAKRIGDRIQLKYTQDLYEFMVLADLAQQCSRVTVGGWDVSSKQQLKAEAKESVISNELNGSNSGTSILKKAFGERTQSLVHTVPWTNQMAQAEADSFFRLNARRFVVGQGVAKANPKLRVGATVELSNLGPLFNGRYTLCEVRHTFDGEIGLRSEFSAERPGIGG
jgi:phage protein D